MFKLFRYSARLYRLLTSNTKTMTLAASFVLVSMLAILLLAISMENSSNNILANIVDVPNNFAPDVSIAYADDGGPLPPPPDP